MKVRVPKQVNAGRLTSTDAAKIRAQVDGASRSAAVVARPIMKRRTRPEGIKP